MGLSQFERRLERLVEGVFAKTLRAGLQPVEIARRLTREMDAQRTLGVRGNVVPNHFTVALSAGDSEHFGSFRTALCDELAEAVRDHASDEGYHFVGPVAVELDQDGSLGPGQFLVAAEVREAPGPLGSLVGPDGRRTPLASDRPTTLGRLEDCDIVLSDPTVSKRHAEIRPEAGLFVIVDLGSTNGTRVNGARVREQRLHDGDRVALGSTELVFAAS